MLPFAQPRFRPEVMLGVLIIAYIFSHVARTVPAIMASSWAAEFNLSPDSLGLIAGMFHVGFALPQLPAGLLFDRIGPRRVVAGLLVIGAFGSVLSAIAAGPTALLMGQFLLGIGFSGALMGTLVFLADWFPASRFAFLSGIVVSLGNTGMLISATPLALLEAAAGWRAVFVLLTAFILLIAAACFLFVRDHENRSQDRPQGDAVKSQDPAGVAVVLKFMGHPAMLGLIALSFISYPALIVMRGLWIGPFFSEVHGLSAIDAGNALLVFSLALIVAPFVFGLLEKGPLRRSSLVVAAGVLTIASLLPLVFRGGENVVMDLLFLTAFGAFGSFYMLKFADVRALAPKHLTGSALSALNLITFGGVAFWQFASGALFAWISPDGPASSVGVGNMTGLTANGFKSVFLMLTIALIVGTIAYLLTIRLREQAGKSVDPQGPGGA